MGKANQSGNAGIIYSDMSSISSLFTAHCYANVVSRHTNPSNFGMMKINRGHNSGNKLEATSVTKKASCY